MDMNKKAKYRREVVLAKMDLNLQREFAKIAGKRVGDGLDARYSPPTVQKKLLKHPLWPQIKKDLEIAKFLEDERGQFTVFSIFTFIIVSFLAVVLFAGLVWVMGLLNTTFHNVGINNEVNSGNPGYVNLTLASDQTFGQANSATQGLRLVALTMIFAMILSVFVTNSLVKIHPAFFFVYILIVVLAVIFSAPIANSYETLLQTNIYDGLLQSFTGSSWLLLNLPLVTGIVGVMGGLFLFINIIRTGGEGQLQ